MFTDSFFGFLMEAGKRGFRIGYEERYHNTYDDGLEAAVVLYREDGIIICANTNGERLGSSYAFAEVPWTSGGYTPEQWMVMPEGGPVVENVYPVRIRMDGSFYRLDKFLEQLKPNKTWIKNSKVGFFLNSEDSKKLLSTKNEERPDRINAILWRKLYDSSSELRAIINK